MKCPKCSAETNEVYVEQKMSTTVNGVMGEDEKIKYEDFDKGYSDGWEWIENMLSDEGKPIIVGCPKCE